MPIENPEVIDMLMQPSEDKLMIVMTDAGITTDREERMNLFVAKLKTYVGFIMSKEFAAEYPALRPKDVTIRLMTRNPPTDEMAAITHVMPRGDKENRIAVEFELFGGADGQMNPNSGGSSVDAKKQVRPWWKFWN